MGRRACAALRPAPCVQCITAGGIEGEVAAGEGESRNMDTKRMGACGERNWRGGLGYNDGPPAVGGATGAPQQESNMGRWACALLRPALVMQAVPAWAIEEEVATGEGRSICSSSSSSNDSSGGSSCSSCSSSDCVASRR